MEVWRKPAPRDEIVGRIMTVMQHYYAPKTYESISEEQFMEWADVLQDVADFAFAQTCKEWVRTKTRRPTPADLLKMGQQLESKELRDYYLAKDAYKHAPALGDNDPTFDLNGERIVVEDAA